MIEHLSQGQGPRALWLATLGIAAILGAYAALGLTDYSAGERVDDVTSKLRPRSTASSETVPNHGQEQAGRQRLPRTGGSHAGDNGQAADAAKRIRERYLFMPRPPEGFRNVQGVLGDRVLYPGGKSFGIGENAMGATVVAIGSNWVELLHDGQTITLDVFGGNERGPELVRWDGETPPASAGQNHDRRQRRWPDGRGRRQR
ncbi:MAG: hypothetical protein AAGH99_12605 [Planctomycetota bacterium]